MNGAAPNLSALQKVMLGGPHIWGPTTWRCVMSVYITCGYWTYTIHKEGCDLKRETYPRVICIAHCFSISCASAGHQDSDHQRGFSGVYAEGGLRCAGELHPGPVFNVPE